MDIDVLKVQNIQNSMGVIPYTKEPTGFGLHSN